MTHEELATYDGNSLSEFVTGSGVIDDPLSGLCLNTNLADHSDGDRPASSRKPESVQAQKARHLVAPGLSGVTHSLEPQPTAKPRKGGKKKEEKELGNNP